MQPRKTMDTTKVLFIRRLLFKRQECLEQRARKRDRERERKKEGEVNAKQGKFIHIAILYKRADKRT